MVITVPFLLVIAINVLLCLIDKLSFIIGVHVCVEKKTIVHTVLDIERVWCCLRFQASVGEGVF